MVIFNIKITQKSPYSWCIGHCPLHPRPLHICMIDCFLMELTFTSQICNRFHVELQFDEDIWCLWCDMKIYNGKMLIILPWGPGMKTFTWAIVGVIKVHQRLQNVRLLLTSKHNSLMFPSLIIDRVIDMVLLLGVTIRFLSLEWKENICLETWLHSDHMIFYTEQPLHGKTFHKNVYYTLEYPLNSKNVIPNFEPYKIIISGEEKIELN